MNAPVKDFSVESRLEPVQTWQGRYKDKASRVFPIRGPWSYESDPEPTLDWDQFSF